MNVQMQNGLVIPSFVVGGKLPKPVKRDGKYSMDDAVYTRFNGKMQWVVALENGLFRHCDTKEQLARSIENRNNEVAAEVAKMEAEVEFKLEVLEAMMEKGIARHVALNRTSTQATLMACAKEFGVI